MKISKTFIEDLLIIEPQLFKDDRGFFYESYNKNNLNSNIVFVQDNESKSISRGVLRGLHYQSFPHTQAKLIRVTNGKVLDVAVDLRRNSKTFGCYVAAELSEENKKQLFIPRGFAHGFIVLSESATIAYKVDAYYAASHNEGIAFNDPDINIDWGFIESEIIISEADKNYPTLNNSGKLF